MTSTTALVAVTARAVRSRSPHDRGHLAEEFTLTKLRQQQSLARPDLDLAAMGKVQLVAFLTGFEDDLTLFERLAYHIQNNFHHAYSWSKAGQHIKTPTFSAPDLNGLYFSAKERHM